MFYQYQRIMLFVAASPFGYHISTFLTLFLSSLRTYSRHIILFLASNTKTGMIKKSDGWDSKFVRRGPLKETLAHVYQCVCGSVSFGNDDDSDSDFGNCNWFLWKVIM